MNDDHIAYQKVNCNFSSDARLQLHSTDSNGTPVNRWPVAQ